MKVIDSDNYRESGIDAFFFPGGEPHARIPKDFGTALLWLKARTWNDVGLAMCVLGALKQQGNKYLPLFVPYFPGARQDRSDGQTPFTARMVMAMFDMYVTHLYTFDAHSDVVGKNVTRDFMPLDLVTDADAMEAETAFIIAPDHGAIERARQLSNLTPNDLIVCEKNRDFATGKFTGFTLPPLPRVGSYVIVDDICDGGGTFNLLAEEFLKDPYGAESDLSLFVSHGIFSKGLNAIHQKIDTIITTDSFTDKTLTGTVADPGRLSVLSLRPIIDKIIKEADYV